eukprot:TRINITY_DN1014_c0_g1_i1.p1 TRINITY_DN1014_c0_g1~~TRINITY_DN1014_c0_g1_i1.p1  ORF type:complete len:130 (+),score=14.52 TRINITY_DN1014_c0_g1_i1:58-447(+)
MANLNKNYFDDKALSWDDLPFSRQNIQNSVAGIKNVVEIKPDFDVMDWGCGTGMLLEAIYGQVNSVTGIDISEKMIEQCKKKQEKDAEFAKKSKFHVLTIDKEDLIQDKFDLITMSNVLHHVSDPKVIG